MVLPLVRPYYLFGGKVWGPRNYSEPRTYPDNGLASGDVSTVTPRDFPDGHEDPPFSHQRTWIAELKSRRRPRGWRACSTRKIWAACSSARSTTSPGYKTAG